ncbi:flavoprotein [Streptomyces sp. NPDC054919]
MVADRGSRRKHTADRAADPLNAEARPHPVADCYVVAPASANYVAKLATGIAKNQALTQVSEALGTIDVPVVVFPGVNAAHVRRPA